MSRPWMPLYCSEYIGHTTHLSAAESGAYLHLIMHHWVHGDLPTEDGPLSRIAKMTPSEWRRAKRIIQPFFNEDWSHERVKKELREAEEAYERRASAGKQGGIAKAKTDSIARRRLDALSKQSPSPSELSPSFHDEDNGERVDFDIEKGFREFFEVYPRQVDHDLVFEKFCAIVRAGEATVDQLMAGARHYRSKNLKTDEKWIKSPIKWLEAGCWKDGALKHTPAEIRDKTSVPRDDPRWSRLSERYKQQRKMYPPEDAKAWMFPNEWLSELHEAVS